MNSGVLDLKMRRKVSLAPAATADDADSAEPAACDAGTAAPADSDDARQKRSTGASRAGIRSEKFIGLLDAGDANQRFMTARGAGSAVK
jgi:hypothetical protein